MEQNKMSKSKGFKIFVVLVIAFVVVIIFAPREQPTSTPVPLAPKTDFSDKSIPLDDRFIDYVHQEYPTSRAIDNYTILNMVKKTCEALVAGLSFETVVALVVSNQVDMSETQRTQMNGIVASGIGVYCPEYLP